MRKPGISLKFQSRVWSIISQFWVLTSTQCFWVNLPNLSVLDMLDRFRPMKYKAKYSAMLGEFRKTKNS